MFYYINNFFTFSILGYIFENILFLIIKTHQNSGFLHLFWTPFYGTGVLIAILLYKLVNKSKFRKHLKILLLGLSLFMVLSVLEFTGGLFLEKLYGYSIWNYEGIPFHIGRYISVPTSLGWVAFAFLYLYFIKKYTDKLVVKIPKFISIALLIVFAIDNIVTIYQILYFRGFI